jgi:hypothetical protein
MEEVSFQEAIKIAKDELKKIQIDAHTVNVEQAIISDDEKLYEITLSYEILLKDNLSPNDEKIPTPTNLQSLSMLLRKKRIYKTFLINMHDGKFRGFKIFK